MLRFVSYIGGQQLLSADVSAVEHYGGTTINHIGNQNDFMQANYVCQNMSKIMKAD